eukprot:COSAG01_NODE_1459_length_10250_cov_5.016846_5_plen_82_part_00
MRGHQQNGEGPRWQVRLVTGQSVALRADGSGLVAYEDREEYARAAEKRWMDQFAPQLSALKTGFHRACCASLVVRRLLHHR